MAAAGRSGTRPRSEGRLEKMRANPKADWTTSDVDAVYREYGLRCTPPWGGSSHYKVSHPFQRDVIMVPYRRPVKQVYIPDLVRYIDAVEAARNVQHALSDFHRAALRR
jgi:hypothetical protein